MIETLLSFAHTHLFATKQWFILTVYNTRQLLHLLYNVVLLQHLHAFPRRQEVLVATQIKPLDAENVPNVGLQILYGFHVISYQNPADAAVVREEGVQPQGYAKPFRHVLTQNSLCSR